MTLKVTPQEVHNKATQIDGQSVTMEQTMKRIEQEMAKTQEAWQSKSGADFLARYRTLQTNCNTTLNKVRTHARNLRETAASYERTEERNIGDVNRLGTGNVLS